MKDSLQPGIEKESEYEVTKDMAPPHLPMPVLSTPSMIGLIEGTCLQLAQAHLGSTETTVGTHVCVSHVGKAGSGEKVRVIAKVKSVDDRAIVFDTEVHSPRRLISSGTHERTVIDFSKFGQKK